MLSPMSEAIRGQKGVGWERGQKGVGWKEGYRDTSRVILYFDEKATAPNRCSRIKIIRGRYRGMASLKMMTSCACFIAKYHTVFVHIFGACTTKYMYSNI